MGRNYANIFTAIWKPGSDFTNRSEGAQRLYLMLTTQAEISAVGVLPLRIRRWSTKSSNSTEEGIVAALAELAEHRYVAVDEETEEVLLRSFTRHDGGYGNPRRLPSIRDGANAIESPKLVRVLSVEFERLEVPAQFRGQAKPQGNSHSDSQSIGKQISMDCLTDSRRVVVTTGPYVEPPTHNPQPPPRDAGDCDPLDARPTGLEGEGDTEDPIETVVAEVIAIRPEWGRRSVAKALRDTAVDGRPWNLVAAAMVAVAKDPKSTVPGRLKHDGPWWTAAAEAVNARASPRPGNEPSCGECGPNRLIEINDGAAMVRCPRCHPNRPKVGAA